MGANDISFLNLALGSLVILIPLAAFAYFKTGMVKDLILSTARMCGQLLLAGVYLKYIFAYDNWIVNIAWVLLMATAGIATILKRSDLKGKRFIIPVGAGVALNVAINAAVFGFSVIGAGSFLSAKYLIPIMGMVIGNTLTSTIVGIKSFYQTLEKEEERYKYNLTCGATKAESLFGFMSAALKMAFSPSIAQNASIGLIWLPGMMTGQILGGSDPITAIKYQILIVLAIFAGGVATVVTTLILSAQYAFDDYDMPIKVRK